MMDVRSRLRGAVTTAVALIVTAATLPAQEAGAIRGVVVDAITGAPLGGVGITVVGSELAAETDAEGSYQLRGIPPGLVKVSAQLIGYVPITTPWYSIRPGATTQIDFKLAPLTVTLDPVEVEGERYSRAENHMGARVITKDQLPRRGSILDALSSIVAGIQTTGRNDGQRTRARGSEREMMFVIDGVAITPPLTFYVDVRDVECVEVRRGYHAAAEFRRNIVGEAYSGVILIWTRGTNQPMPPSCRGGNPSP